MFAVVVRVELPEGGNVEQGRQMLEKNVIPTVRQSPGFVAGYWLAPPTGLEGLSVLIYEDEQSARTVAGSVQPPPPVTLLGVEVREVTASATA
jgi:hypothetical protein